MDRMGATVRALGAVLMVALPIGASSAGMSKPDPGKFGMEYTIADNQLKSCKINGSLGNPDVDEAVCLLMERCVTEGNVTQETAAVCIRPRLARMLELVNAGLLDELDGAPEGSAEGPQARDGDIVVQGRRLPRDGLWLISETGYRMHHADMKVPIEQLPQRSWRQCIKGGELETILQTMLRDDPQRTAKSPCQWTVKTSDGKVAGEQLCTHDGFTERGKLSGGYSETQFRVAKDVRVRQLFVGEYELQKRRQIASSLASSYGLENEMPNRRSRTPGSGARSISEDLDIDRSNDQEFINLVGYRVRSC